MYVHDIASGITVSDREPHIINEKAATAYVDGCNLLGPVVGDFCMKLAIQKAKSSGVGFVTANSMHTSFILLHNTSVFCKLIILIYSKAK